MKTKNVMMLATLLIGSFLFSGCTSPGVSENKERVPQSQPTGVGSVGSGSIDLQNVRAVVRKCDENTPSSLDSFVEKKSYSNENVRVFLVDSIEPACCSQHLVIYIPDAENQGSECFHVASSESGLGFSGVQMNKIKSSYHPSRGLNLTIPFYYYDPSSSSAAISKLKYQNILINQGRRTVEVQR